MIDFVLSHDVKASEEIQRMLRSLPKTLQSKTMRSAFPKAGKTLESAIKRNIQPFKVKFKSGTKITEKEMRKSVKTMVRRGRRDGQLYAVVGPTYEDGRISHWLEYGTLAHRDKPLESKRSEAGDIMAAKGLGMKKNPFMRQAVAQTGDSVQRLLKFEVLKAIQKHVASSLRQGKL